jgi:Fe/S biogenesis protein NfuA
MLESHGGEVSLLEFTEKGEAILQFGGGCQGCGMVDVTLKEGIEKTLIEQIPELNSVVDSTDHTLKDNAYYKD